MKKDFEVFEIGNGIWSGKLADESSISNMPVYKHFYGLSEKSVSEQIRKYKKSASRQRYENKTNLKMSEISMGG